VIDDMLEAGGPVRFKLKVMRDEIAEVQGQLDLVVTELVLGKRLRAPTRRGSRLLVLATRAAKAARQRLQRAHVLVERALSEEPVSHDAMEELEELERRNQ
jgi:hypothetical protein